VGKCAVSEHAESVTPQAPRLRWSEREPAAAAVAYVLSYLLLSIGGQAASYVRLPVIALALLALVVAIGTLLFSLLLVLSISRLRVRPWAEVAWLFGMLALFVFARPDAAAIVGRWLGDPAGGKRIAEFLTITPEQALIGNAALILWAVFLGRLVSRVIREGKLLLPVAVVASIADTITVFYGLVAHMVREAPEVVRTFSTQAPVPPPSAISMPVLTSVGLGDFLFLAMFLTVAVRYSMNAVKGMWAALVAMLVAPLAFLLWPEAPGMPGLPFISLAVLGTNWRHLTFTRDEKRALTVVGTLVLAVSAWVLWRH